MSKIVFLTSLTEDYQKQASRLLSSLKLLKRAEPYVMTLGFSLPDNEGYRSIRVPDMALPIYRVPQQGQLIDLVPSLTDDDIAIMADADARIQRDLLNEEVYRLNQLGDRVGMACNNGDQNGMSEAVICILEKPVSEVEKHLGKLADIPIFNCGLIAAKPPTWRKIKQKFEELWPAVKDCFVAWRSCQLVLCAAIKLAGVEVTNLGYSMHTHGHFPPQPLHAVHDKTLYYGNRPVFFVHRVDGFWGDCLY